MTPMEVAHRLMERRVDPGMIVKYLELELAKDPTLVMTPLEASCYRFRKVWDGMIEGLERSAQIFMETTLAWDPERKN